MHFLQVADFGFARALDSSVDLAASHVGSPLYCAPGQTNNTRNADWNFVFFLKHQLLSTLSAEVGVGVAGGGTYSQKVDVWSLGVVLFESEMRPNPS